MRLAKIVVSSIVRRAMLGVASPNAPKRGELGLIEMATARNRDVEAIVGRQHRDPCPLARLQRDRRDLAEDAELPDDRGHQHRALGDRHDRVAAAPVEAEHDAVGRC